MLELLYDIISLKVLGIDLVMHDMSCVAYPILRFLDAQQNPVLNELYNGIHMIMRNNVLYCAEFFCYFVNSFLKIN
jgi:hypothetical protein